MLKEHNRLILRAHKVLDICLTTAAFIGSYFIKRLLLPAPFAGLITVPNYYVVLFMIIIIWYIMFDLFGLYGSYRKRSFWQIFLHSRMFRAALKSGVAYPGDIGVAV